MEETVLEKFVASRLGKILLGVVIVAVVVGATGYHFRKELILFAIAKMSKSEVAENRPVIWESGPTESSLPADKRPPNIIFIVADDLGINDISTFGGGVAGGAVPTPNIDRLAATGAIFKQAYAGAGSCAPSRAMLMTGRYPTRTGFEFTPLPNGMAPIVAMFQNDLADEEGSPLPKVVLNKKKSADTLPFDDQGLPGSEITIAELLKGAGYHTVHIGKWHLGRGKEFGPNAQGFDESLLMASARYLPEDDPDVVNVRLPFDPIDQFLWASMQYAASFDEGPYFKPRGYLTDYWTDESVKVIHENRNRPFFLYLAHFAPHSPLQATREDYEAVGDLKPKRLRVYAAMVHALDRSIGKILDALDEEGLADNTIVVFTSDNGGAGYLGLPGLNAPYRGWKVTMFEGGLRVPLFVRWPEKIKPGTVIDTPVAHIDIMPTLAKAGGATIPSDDTIDGVDLLPALEDGVKVRGPNDPLFWESGDYKVVRQGDWKLQVSPRQNKKWLYNLANDPTEQVNLVDSEPAKLAQLEGLLSDHAAGARPPLYTWSIAAPVLVDKTKADKVEKGDEYVIWQN
ncbi:MAG: sulfatase-like hydrolase/transferase [Rhizobiales bacterium]|nr:sulfatase-like hydrolase/transferase [Hyphomicrobiales bacterium]